MSNSDQSTFSNKPLMVDISGKVIPQYYDEDNEYFVPNTAGISLVPSGIGPNPYQDLFSTKKLLVDKQGRVIPQYYDVNLGLFTAMTEDGGGIAPTGFVRSVNDKVPDQSGNVTTDFHVIDMIRADVNWTDYPSGKSEFYADYNKADYTQYIAENPSFNMLPNGKIAVRTFVEPAEGVAYQQIDNVQDGTFFASFVRVGNQDGTWGDLVETSCQHTPSGDFVLSVNDILPDENGNVVLPTIESNYHLLSTFDTDAVISAYEVGTSIAILIGGEPGYDNILLIMNDRFDWSLTQQHVMFEVITTKLENGPTTQSITAIFKNNGAAFGMMKRSSIGDDLFSIWSIQAQILYGKGLPTTPGMGLGMKGNLYVNTLTGVVYSKKGADKTPGYTGWAVLSPTVVENPYTPVVGDVETVYSAWTSNEMLTTHEHKKTTIDSLGHVMVDDDTIGVDAQGKIFTYGRGVVYPGADSSLRFWASTTTVSGGNGNWTLDISGAQFTQIRSVQVTLESTITTDGDKPLGSYITSKSLTSISGKAYKVTAAGLLAAMVSLPAENGTIVNVMVMGH